MMENITTPDGELARPIICLAIQQTGSKTGELIVIKSGYLKKVDLLMAMELFKKYLDGL